MKPGIEKLHGCDALPNRGGQSGVSTFVMFAMEGCEWNIPDVAGVY